MKNLRQNLKKGIILGVLFLASGEVQAQAVRSKVNEILSDYVLPVFILGLVGTAIYGLIKNADLIEDRDNLGTRTKGFINVGYIVLYALVAELVIGAIIAIAGSINFQI